MVKTLYLTRNSSCITLGWQTIQNTATEADFHRYIAPRRLDKVRSILPGVRQDAELQLPRLR
jgi:hypothetical protein